MTIGTYYYFYGPGTEPNRKIEFYRENSNDPTTIKAKVLGKRNGEWLFSSSVSGDLITLERASTIEKVQEIMRARQLGEEPNLPCKPLSQLSLREQDSVIHTLEPNGEWIIEVENNVGGQNNLELIKRVTIFNPS